MQSIIELFVLNPPAILLLAGLFFAAYLIARASGALPRPGALLWPAIAWAAWAAWEFLIVRFSPEANIRVDLLVIVPLELTVSVVGIVMSFAKPKTSESEAA